MHVHKHLPTKTLWIETHTQKEEFGNTSSSQPTPANTATDTSRGRPRDRIRGKPRGSAGAGDCGESHVNNRRVGTHPKCGKGRPHGPGRVGAYSGIENMMSSWQAYISSSSVGYKAYGMLKSLRNGKTFIFDRFSDFSLKRDLRRRLRFYLTHTIPVTASWQRKKNFVFWAVTCSKATFNEKPLSSVGECCLFPTLPTPRIIRVIHTDSKGLGNDYD